MRSYRGILLGFFLYSSSWILAQDYALILDERNRARVEEEILQDRLENLLPQLMERAGIDMWILISREYNEDPIMKTMLPSTWLSARRRTIMVFHQGEEIFEKVAIARYDVGKLLAGSWDLNVFPDQWDALIDLIREKDPRSIALNYSDNFGLADGLAKTEYETFMQYLPEDFHSRVISAENLAVSWLETRSPKELEIYPMICKLAHQILRDGLSEQSIHPGITTTDDVVWHLRQKVTELGLDTWFHPSVSVQRSDTGNQEFLRSFSKRPADQVILAGDLVHVDFGITYLRLNTDQQEHFYVVGPDENKVPEYLQMAFAKGNRLQDILTENFIAGRSGNEILLATLDQAEKEGITASVYTHPIGLHGHAAGPTIGMWDKQQGVPGTGDYPLFANTAYSIELFAASEITEWSKIVRIMLEQDGFFDGEKFHWLDGRQQEIWTIPQNPNR